MVIAPFTFIKTTAFKERMQLADKLNEVITVLNQYPVTITDITMTTNNGTFTTTFYLSDGSTKSYTYTLEDYVTNSALATILNDYVTNTSLATTLNDYATKDYVDTKDSANVKLTGDQSISGTKTFNTSPTVPDTPTTHGAVSNAYVNDPTDGINNIVHKSGNEIINGSKTFTDNAYLKNVSNMVINFQNKKFNVIGQAPYSGGYDENDNPIGTLSNANCHVFAIDDNAFRYGNLQFRYSTNKTVSIFLEAVNKDANNVNHNVGFEIGSQLDGVTYFVVNNQRDKTLSDVTGSTLYDRDVVTIKTLKDLGLI